MSKTAPVPTLVTYVPKKGKEDEFEQLVRKHWPALEKLGLVTPEKAKLWRGHDKRADKTTFVELFTWKDGESSGIAHQTPEVMAIWEPMGPIMESMQIVQLTPLT